MTPVLNWLKSNVATVIFLVVMVAALVALPILSGKMNGAIQETVEDRLSQLTKLDKLEKTKVSFGNPVYGAPEDKTGLVNRKLLERFKEVSEAESADAEAVRRAAEAHNKKGRGVLMDFAPTRAEDREVLPEQFYSVVIDAYDQFLDAFNAGSPPSLEKMTEEITRKRAQYRSQVLAKDENAPLDAEEKKTLDDVLTKKRMSLYAQAAGNLSMYASADALNPPFYEQAAQPTMTQLFDWQWQYWITEDLLLALAAANGPEPGVQNTAVKHVRGIWVGDHVFAGSAGSSGSGGGGGSSSAPGLGGGGEGRRGPAGSGAGGRGAAVPAGPPPIQPNPSQEVKPDYMLSFTGRATNPLYDVRTVQMSVVLSTARIPRVLDEIAKRNFITILDIDVRPGDHYAAAREGFIYGSEPVSELTLLLETVWLRSWTSEHMPLELKQVLRVPFDTPASG